MSRDSLDFGICLRTLLLARTQPVRPRLTVVVKEKEKKQGGKKPGGKILPHRVQRAASLHRASTVAQRWSGAVVDTWGRGDVEQLSANGLTGCGCHEF